MSDPRLSSPSSIRLVAAAAAAVASLGVVALGVQLGTSGLVGDGPGRNPGSRSATPASATVDLPRSRPATGLDQQLLALVPALGADAFGSSSAADSFSSTPTPTAVETPAAVAPPADGGTAPAPSPLPPAPSPLPPAPIPTPESPVPTPAPIPAPEPTIPPALAPVVEPVTDVVDDLGVVPDAGDQNETAPAPTLDDLVRLLLGP